MSKRPKADKPKRIRPDRIPEGLTLAGLRRLRDAVQVFARAMGGQHDGVASLATFTDEIARVPAVMMGVREDLLQANVRASAEKVDSAMLAWVKSNCAPQLRLGATAAMFELLAHLETAERFVAGKQADETTVPKGEEAEFMEMAWLKRPSPDWDTGRFTIRQIQEKYQSRSRFISKKTLGNTARAICAHGWAKNVKISGNREHFYAIEAAGEEAYARFSMVRSSKS